MLLNYETLLINCAKYILSIHIMFTFIYEYVREHRYEYTNYMHIALVVCKTETPFLSVFTSFLYQCCCIPQQVTRNKRKT